MTTFTFYYKAADGIPWEEITELEVHAKLYAHMKQTTPAIRQLLREKIYRLSTNESFRLLEHG